MRGGDAYKVESALHYMFDAHSREMPAGAGYTEWFNIEAWGDVLAFLAEQRERLRIGEAQPIVLPSPRVRADLAEIEARRQAKAAELAEKRHAWELREAERHAKNAEWNRHQIERLETSLLTMDGMGALRGILVYDELSSGQRQAAMYLSLPASMTECFGEGFRRPAGHDFGPLGFRLFAERGGACDISVFPSYCARYNDRHFLAQVRVNPDFIMLQPHDDLAERIPSAATVQALLLPFVARKGERRGPQLARLHRWMNASLSSASPRR